MPYGPLALGFLAGAVLAGVVMWARFTVRLHLATRDARKQSVALSRATLYGKVGEQLAPLLPEFPYDLEDARFLGAPIDYIVFDGYAQGDDVEVVFVEVKTGNARLSRGEKRIRDAVLDGRVRFETVRL